MQKNRYVTIPKAITVHLGRYDAPAADIRLPFVDYIKGCANAIICPVWPENAIRANLYAINSYVLNRVCNKWYRARGYAFDITACGEDDLPFNMKKGEFYNINCLAEAMFNDYIIRQGDPTPLLTRICCHSALPESGALNQAGAVAMAENGATAYSILRKYYGEDIAIVENASQQGDNERFLGTPLMPGAAGETICALKQQLNRIGKNYSAIKPLDENKPDFDADCESAVRTFQYIFDLPPTGVIDKATWYDIKQKYAEIIQADNADNPPVKAAVANKSVPIKSQRSVIQQIEMRAVLESEERRKPVSHFSIGSGISAPPLTEEDDFDPANSPEWLKHYYGL